MTGADVPPLVAQEAMPPQAITEPHPEGNPALAAAVEAVVARRLAASHGSGDDTGRRAALLLEILPDAAAALEAAAPHMLHIHAEHDARVAAVERERCARLIEQQKEARSSSWYAALLREQP